MKKNRESLTSRLLVVAHVATAGRAGWIWSTIVHHSSVRGNYIELLIIPDNWLTI